MPRRRVVWTLLLVAAASAPIGWAVSDRLESDDDFCTSCHLSEGVPLHEAKLADFRATPPVSLAVAHAVAGNEAHADAAFRCIDCHGGTGLVGRARVKLLSAKDAFWYVVGRFDEPDRMHWPLWDADCTQCHARFDDRAPPGEDPLFHELVEHRTAFSVRCVECHLSHDEGGLADHDFLHPTVVRGRCAQCHLEFEEGSP